jgi:hypothetical protein
MRTVNDDAVPTIYWIPAAFCQNAFLKSLVLIGRKSRDKVAE